MRRTSKIHSPEFKQCIPPEHRAEEHPIRLEQMTDLGKTPCSNVSGPFPNDHLGSEVLF